MHTGDGMEISLKPVKLNREVCQKIKINELPYHPAMPSGTLSPPCRGKLQPRLLQDCSSWNLTRTQKEDWGKNRRGRREK